MFYLFFAGIAVLATPVAVLAVMIVWERLRSTKHTRWAAAVVVVFAIQLEIGVFGAVLRLQHFGPPAAETPIPVNMLEVIRQLPPGGKLAYSCRPLDESGFGVPQLVSIDAHTRHRVVPMCFEAELLSTLIGAKPSDQVENRFFPSAPQRAIYPDAEARPSSSAVANFLKAHGVEYIFADTRHPNTLVDNAIPMAVSGDAMVLRIP
jgi:hypothetical protein